MRGADHVIARATAVLLAGWFITSLGVMSASSAAAVTSEQVEQLVDESLDGLLARQVPWGGFDDPLAGPRFNYGAVALGWLGTRRAVPGPQGEARRQAPR
jgi:hypothetical protein